MHLTDTELILDQSWAWREERQFPLCTASSARAVGTSQPAEPRSRTEDGILQLRF
jgi:hypothetical protein